MAYPNPYSDTNNIIIAGVILIVYEALLLISYYILSVAFPPVLSGIITSGITPELATQGPITLTIFDYMFALAFLTPIFGFFVWIWRRESGHQFRRFY